MNIPFGLSQYTTRMQTFAQDLGLFRELGIRHMEVCESKLETARRDRQLEALKASGLMVSSVQPGVHSPFPNSLRKTPASPKERMKRLKESVQLFGRHFPGTVLVVNTGIAPQADLASAYRIAEHEFKRISQFAADHGVRIGLEPLNPVFMNTDTFICSLAHAGRLMEAVDHPNFGLFLDVWHYWEEADSAALVRKYGAKIFGVHVSDWRTPRASGDRLLPGDGEIPLVEMLRTIRETGYRGIYTLEVFSDLRLPDSLWAKPRQTVRDGQNAFAKIWRKTCD